MGPGGGVATAAAALAAGAAAARARGRTRRVAHAVRRMDPDEQAREVMWLFAGRDFGWDNEIALSLALFRTYAVPSISVLLDATGEFTQRPQKRYDDTELVIGEMTKHGLDHERGHTALRRMNAMHAAYDISQDDMLYVLTTFICEPIRWAERFGWRAPTQVERQASARWYAEVGRHMGLSDVPDDYGWFDSWNRAFEAAHLTYHPANRRVADASVRLFLDLYLPRALHGIGEVAVRAMLDQPLLDAFGYDPAPPAVVGAVRGALRLRAWTQRNLLPERRTLYDLTTVDRPTYPLGHVVAELGTFPTRAQRDRANAALAELRS